MPAPAALVSLGLLPVVLARRLAFIPSPHVLGRFRSISPPTPGLVSALERPAAPPHRRPPAASPTRRASWCLESDATVRRSSPRCEPRGCRPLPPPEPARPCCARAPSDS